MDCLVFGTKPLSEPMQECCQLLQNSYIFIQENTFENIFCKMVAIFSVSMS